MSDHGALLAPLMEVAGRLDQPTGDTLRVPYRRTPSGRWYRCEPQLTMRRTTWRGLGLTGLMSRWYARLAD